MNIKREIAALYLLDDPDMVYLEKAILNNRNIYREDENYISKIIAYNDSIVDESDEVKWKYALKSDLPSLRSTIVKSKSLYERIYNHLNEVCGGSCGEISKVRIHKEDSDRIDVFTSKGEFKYCLTSGKPAWSISGESVNELLGFKVSKEIEHKMLSKWLGWCYDNSRMSTKLILDKVKLPESLSWDWYNRQKVGGHTGVFISDYSSNNITRMRDLLDGIWRTSPPDRQNIWKRLSGHILHTHFMNKVHGKMKKEILEGVIDAIRQSEQDIYYMTKNGFSKIDYDNNDKWSESPILSEDKEEIEMSGGRFRLKARVSTGKSPMFNAPKLELIVEYN